MKKLLVVAILFLACLALAPRAHAQSASTHPLFDLSRASLAGGVDYAAYQQQGVQPLPVYRKEFEVGLYGAYVLTPHVTLTGSGAWALDNKWIRYRIGVRTVLWKGRD